MKDRLLYLTIGLLIGIVVMQWTMPTGQASGVTTGSGIIAIDGNHALDENGLCWGFWWSYNEGQQYCWDRDPTGDPPVPMAQVKLWTQLLVVTTDNSVWVRDAVDTAWQFCGPWPGGPVPTSPNTWGGVKGKYHGNR